MDELSPEDQAAVLEVLAGTRSYDAVGGAAQSAIRLAWDARLARAIREIDLVAEFRASGITNWVTTDPDGRVEFDS